MNVIDFQIMHLNDKEMKDKCGYCDSKKENPGAA
jgi:hypothetical protein